MAAENIDISTHINKQTDIELNITTLNTQGFKTNIMYINNLINQSDVLFLSEHWLSNAEKSLLENISQTTHKLLFTPTEKKIAGRPYGGNCFLIRNQLVNEHHVIYEDSNILAIQLKSSSRCSGRFLICGGDLPFGLLRRVLK